MHKYTESYKVSQTEHERRTNLKHKYNIIHNRHFTRAHLYQYYAVILGREKVPIVNMVGYVLLLVLVRNCRALATFSIDTTCCCSSRVGGAVPTMS